LASILELLLEPALLPVGILSKVGISFCFADVPDWETLKFKSKGRLLFVVLGID